MADQTPLALLSFVGSYVELGACLLVTALVVGLYRGARDYRYFGFWTAGWVALSAALISLVASYAVPVSGPVAPGGASPPVLALYSLYQSCKLLFLFFVSVGIWSLVRQTVPSRRVLIIGPLAAIAAGVSSALAARTLDQTVMVQGFVGAPVYFGTAWALNRSGSVRRSLGTRAIVAALTLWGVLSLLYIFGFARAGVSPTEWWSATLAFLVGNNAYFDAGVLVILGIGMSLTLVEQTHRDAKAALAQRIEEVTEAQARLAQIHQAVLEGIVTLDRDRRIEDMNGAAAAILGADPVLSRGRPFDDFVRPDHRASLWDQLSLQTRRSEASPPVVARREIVGQKEDGGEVPLEIALSSYGDGTLRGYVIVLRDLTEQRESDEDRERLQQQLAQTARLETVGRMVSGVAHELNNPLTAMMAFAQDMLLSARSEEDREALTVIVQQAQRCRVIVGDLLIFARSRRDERRRVAPADLVKRVARVFERDSARHGVRFGIEVASDLPPVDIDAVGMEQVLANLLTNAFQATPAGGLVELSIRPAGDRLEVVVQDNGPGISAEAMPRLFEPFYTTKAPGQGTGLGLSVSHAIVEQHGGSIEAENRRDRPTGARFTVRLPFVDRRTGPARPVNVERTPPVGVPAVGRPRKVLVVDDEPAIRSAIRRALERRGWTVDEAGDGGEAKLLLDVGGQLADYDAIVTDLRMPGVSGVDLYQWLKTRHPAALARTVVITGDTASPMIAQFLASLRGPCLQKPFDMRALFDVLERVTAVAS